VFDAFWRATGEPPFDALTASRVECYRLSIETSLTPQHRVYRMQRCPPEAPRFVAHYFVFGRGRDEATARTYEVALEGSLWQALHAQLAAGRFWELPEENKRCGLDGATYSLEGWWEGRRHKVVRWSPNPSFSGGELFALITDFLERLGQLATLERDPEIRERYVPD
jgi:hypothetical protein